MLSFGRGIVDGRQCPLFAGIVDPVGKRPINSMTPVPPGIRVGDFNWCGNNLLHDLPFLEALGVLTAVTGDPQYTQAFSDICAFYPTNCADPVTGLFPWGEHAQWSFSDRAALPCSFHDGLKQFLKDGYIIHEHHQFAPAWFWEPMYRHNPQAVVKFARGLNNHITHPKTFEHNRHAPLNGKEWRDLEEPDTVGKGKDFARHSGFYIFDCLFAYSKTGDTGLLEWARRKAHYHLARRLPNGIVRGCERSKEFNSEGQHDAFALCLSDAAGMLGDTNVGREFASYAAELFEARRAVGPSTPAPAGDVNGSVWVDGYFRKPAIPLPWGNVTHDVYARTGIQSYADLLIQSGDWMVKHLPDPPPGIPVLARRFRFMIDLALSAYAVSGNPGHLAMAEKIGHWALKDLFHSGLIIGISNMKLMWFNANGEYHVDPWSTPNTPGFYYSCTGTPALVRTLLKLGLILKGKPEFLGIDSYHR
jgi:hypothetical protein